MITCLLLTFKSPVDTESRQNQSEAPKELSKKPDQGLSEEVPAQAPRPGKKRGACAIPQALRAPAGPATRGPALGHCEHFCYRLPRKPKDLKAQSRADKRQSCSHSLAPCHPQAPWGCTCGIWMFPSQRPRERKTATASAGLLLTLLPFRLSTISTLSLLRSCDLQ